MKKFLGATAITLALCTSAASAESLSVMDQKFVVMFTATMVVAIRCPDVTVIPGGAIHWAEQNGVDGPKFSGAVKNALAFGTPTYDQAKAIPEVNKLGARTIDVIGDALGHAKVPTCRKWSEALDKQGFIKWEPKK